MTATSVFSSVPTTFAWKFAAILEFHVDAIRAFDDVVVGVDIAIRPDDESGAFALHRLRVARHAARIIFILRTLKEEIVERGIVRRRAFFVTSMITTLGATISKTLAKALFS